MAQTDGQPSGNGSKFSALALGALGVVYGDIGTSPLYTLRECFAHAGLKPTPENVIGVLSLIFWSVTVVVSVKYVTFVMRADNRGEGGTLALMALALRTGGKQDGRDRKLIVFIAMFGVALFFGDGMITPAISVLSAVEGLEIATPLFKPYIVPIALTILVGLFVIQRRGTARVGRLFGPIMCVWFFCLAVLGFKELIFEPRVFMALNPWHAIQMFVEHKWLGFLVLGAVVLAFTGAEALYADMGHFGRRPIRLVWFYFVLPALMINYFGQGALIIRDPAAAVNPFYLIVPESLLYPMVILSTMATVIASQAVISGAFSVSRQAVQLGYWPRLRIEHTSESEIGQIYVPQVNWMLCVAVVALVLLFQSSSNLANAYGIAVTLTMAADTFLIFVVMRNKWDWSPWLAFAVAGSFLFVDVLFVGSTLIKVSDGGWFPLIIGAVLFTLLVTWKRGRRILSDNLRESSLSLDLFLSRVTDTHPLRVPGTAIYMTSTQHGVPFALLHNLKHNKVLHNRVVLLTVVTEEIPRMAADQRVSIDPLEKNFWRITVRYGFMERPNVPAALALCKKRGVEFNLADTSFFLGREHLIPAVRPLMALWREKIFFWMTRNAVSATDFFGIPTNRVVELGTQVEL